MIPINNFNFVGEIGEGGMGKVYRYAHVRLNRDVAIKFLQPELSSREDLVERFKSEAIAQARMSHTNIATVYEFDQINDMFYMVLEYVKGETLDSVISKEGRLSWQIAVQYAIGILDGLDHAHSFNIVHRDIKPSNLMITEQKTVKILDFGIARILNTARLTKTRHAIGTLEYMSPEQIKAHETDARSDIYAVGIVLYEMLTGQIPFVKDTEFELQQAHINEKPKSPCTFSEEIPKEIARLVLKALEKNPEKRFSSAREFSEALRKQIAFAPPRFS
ncbi:serine/threonine protein kinase [Crenothrix polyspora]|uniref:non-specific serine/threonine protein kinase n=1 Tax=Crenothrix polyspora TaxID=360316 RepID=A0A1R4HE29_9GAMM